MTSASINLISAKLRDGVVGGKVTSQEVTTLPTGVTAPAGQIVNKYFQITPQGFQDGDVVSAEVTFQVATSWLTQNNIHPLSVKFSRWDDARKVWVPLTARFQGEANGVDTYSVNPNPFSLWAITGSTTASAATVRVDNLKIATGVGAAKKSTLVTVDVVNLTAAEQDFTTTLWMNDQATATQSVRVGANQTVPLSFTVDVAAGTYRVRVDRLQDVATVPQAPPVQTGDIAPSGMFLAGLLALGILLVLAGGYVMRRSVRSNARA